MVLVGNVMPVLGNSTRMSISRLGTTTADEPSQLKFEGPCAAELEPSFNHGILPHSKPCLLPLNLVACETPAYGPLFGSSRHRSWSCDGALNSNSVTGWDELANEAQERQYILIPRTTENTKRRHGPNNAMSCFCLSARLLHSGVASSGGGLGRQR